MKKIDIRLKCLELAYKGLESYFSNPKTKLSCDDESLSILWCLADMNEEYVLKMAEESDPSEENEKTPVE